jgi:hypothetical protein
MVRRGEGLPPPYSMLAPPGRRMRQVSGWTRDRFSAEAQTEFQVVEPLDGSLALESEVQVFQRTAAALLWAWAVWLLRGRLQRQAMVLGG